LADVDRFGSSVAVTSVSVLLPGVASKLAELTVTELVTDAAAVSSTLTVSVMGGKDAPGFKVGAWVQVTTCPAAPQVQPGPVAELKVRPGGKVSVTVTVLSSRSMPAAFATVIVYAPVPPATNVPLWVLVTLRSTAGSDVALTTWAMSSTRSAPAEYTVVALVWPGANNALTSYWSTSTP
jgi:hypothetical protein